MTGKILDQPTETEMPIMVGAVNLINHETYRSLRIGNVIATSDGYAVKYSDVEGRALFTGFLGPCRILEKFMVLSPSISGGVLDLRDSDITKCILDSKDEAKLFEALTNVGLRQ